MEMLIDSSTLLAVLLNEPQRAALLRATEGAELLAPSSIPFEIGNAISAMFRRKSLGLAEGMAVYHGFLRIPIRFVDFEIPEALIIADAARIYAYDAYLIQAAREFRCPILTLDMRLRIAARERDVEIVEV